MYLFADKVLSPGNGQKLPESTIIASASNYKANIPPMCDITAPNLNRFCVVNFGPQSFEGLYSEFLQDADSKSIISSELRTKVYF